MRTIGRFKGNEHCQFWQSCFPFRPLIMVRGQKTGQD